MIVKRKVHAILLTLLALLVLGGCSFANPSVAEVSQATSTPRDIPTWTPRPGDPTALPTATEAASVAGTTTASPAAAEPTAAIPTPKTVAIAITGGNLNVRRGPSIDYNYVGVLYDGEVVQTVGRDRVSRWVLIELPSESDKRGWITTETQYTDVQGDVSSLPFISVEPANPAYIRNCTKHTMRVIPTRVELLSKFDEPYNEERFGVGTYQVYDLENPDVEVLQEVSLSEGQTVDILFDWTGEKSKCTE